eukprot:Gregarina_sp_Poly_1__10767@NODE_824_length_6127_cov_330_289274_g596_i0_p3_GENE_NODE_824_length_6127_cov_330_289274_g596_i0NODE_824_length_6127_cov_330_289274_g596_i0_p3_ORF_typecomplete_len507_score67_44Aldedh/PF00171_22/7_7e43DUF1487/PF07368_11/0_27_NODE_824_length_6127_cov_330_289274_g596_i02781798
MPELNLPPFVQSHFLHPGFPTPTPSQKVILSWSALPIQPLQPGYPTKATRSQIEVHSKCIFDNVEEAVEAALLAQRLFCSLSLCERKKIILAIRKVASSFQEDFAWCAWSETSRGRYEDKIVKQRLAIEATPGPEELNPECVTGDAGVTVVDLAPYGVIGALTPVTDPTATVLSNAITILSGGNGAVFNPHASAVLCTNRAVAVVNEAVIASGGPANLVTSTKNPSVDSGLRLMRHPGVSANLVTGGMDAVNATLVSGKRAICAGPGNPPVIVDETADIPAAGRLIVEGAGFDNNMTSSDEKEVFVVEEVCDALIESMKAHGAYHLEDQTDINRLMELVFIPTLDDQMPSRYASGKVNKDLVGIDASQLLSLIGVEVIEPSHPCKLVVFKCDPGHPLVWTEQLMPILPVVPVDTFGTALDWAKKAEQGLRHTSSIFSGNLNRISMAAKTMNTAIFVINGSNTAGLSVGGEGYASLSIAGVTGEGVTRPSSFVRRRKLVCVEALRFV